MTILYGYGEEKSQETYQGTVNQIVNELTKETNSTTENWKMGKRKT